MRSTFLTVYGPLTLLLACRSQSAATTGDSRTALELPSEAANAVRAEMRTMLGSLHSVLAAAPQRDTAAMRAAAQASGMAAAVDTALEHLLPQPFVVLGTATHRNFDSLAQAVGRRIPQDSVVALLGRLTTNCVACHAMYRLAAARGP